MDIREYKKSLRNKVKKFRRNLDPCYKEKMDNRIADIFLNSQLYKNSTTVLCYVSTPIEVNTKKIIETALSEGKAVAVPRCIKNTRFMEFIPIKSYDDLEKGTFGVLEPKPHLTNSIKYDKNTVCLIPALMYDSSGYRLGYGGGYYDRFLSKFKGKSVGIIYSHNITHHLFHGRYDVPVSYIISQSYLKKISRNID